MKWSKEMVERSERKKWSKEVVKKEAVKSGQSSGLRKWSNPGGGGGGESSEVKCGRNWSRDGQN